MTVEDEQPPVLVTGATGFTGSTWRIVSGASVIRCEIWSAKPGPAPRELRSSKAI